jgi:hypothetical protein
MRIPSCGRTLGGLLAVSAMMQLAGPGTASASVISSSATLPVLGVPYTAAVGAGCFPAVAKCISSGSLTLTALVSSTFGGGSQDIEADATYSGELTTLLGVPVAPVMLTGTLDEQVLGRIGPDETGSWTTKLTALSLSGPVLGSTLTLGLDPAHASTGTTSITPVGGNAGTFKIDSFFDIFVELTLDSPPLETTRGPILATLGAPEPASLALLAPALLGLLAARRRASGPAKE